MGFLATAKEVRSLRESLREQSDHVRDLQSDCKHLRLEWEELYDKVRHQMSRMSKRAPSASSANGDPPSSEPSEHDFPGVDPISRSIMLRRGMQGLKR